MSKYIIQKDERGNRKKINIVLGEHQDEDGVFVSKINPAIFLSNTNANSYEELKTAIALFEKNLNYKTKEIGIES